MLPSTFMRRLHPEYCSDTADRTAYQLDAPTLEYHLETITARNETHDFEVFCRKLCERTICPNLRPATGPEGGGDSKADTENIPVADEISNLTYVGEANAGRERWAFAFSAKKKWADKVRADVAGIVATGRDYQKIFCVTARFARAKDRARIEDELSRKYGVTVTILDRTWIVDEVISKDRKDLAFNYLGVGQEIGDASHLGPTDYSRAQQLNDIERSLDDPEGFAGMEMQRATEALVAAKLSRNLERPRTETDGRFARAIRFAEADGSYRQQLEARYEWIWTGFWWFDDIPLLCNNYDSFESLAFETDHAKNIEFLCNLAQLLFNAVLFGHANAEEAKLFERVERLRNRLSVIAGNAERPNNALEAQTSLLTIQVDLAFMDNDPAALAALWPKFSDLLTQAKGLGEFSAERLVEMIQVFGDIAGNDPGYSRLVDEVAAFVSERTSEGQGALILLKRAQQLDFDDRFEMIRLLGKAAHQLTKKEYADSLIEALRLLSLAYRSAGLLWAARASCIFAIAVIFIEAEDDNDLPASVVPTLMLLAFISVELRHLPDAFEAVRLVRGCIAGLPLTEPSKEHAAERLQHFDMVLASIMLNFQLPELERIDALPDVLDRLGLHQSRTSLLYALGYEHLLREDGSIPPEETQETVAEIFTRFASQPVSNDLDSPVIFNEPGPQLYVSRVLGIRMEVRHEGSVAAILAGEAVIASIEALFATTLDLDAQPHAQEFIVTVQESDTLAKPEFTIDRDRMTATVQWPADLSPAAYRRQGEVNRMLVHLAASIFAATCLLKDAKATLDRFFADDAVLDRIAMIAVIGNSHQRFLNSAVSRLKDWTELSETSFPLKESRPNIVRRKLKPSEEGDEDDRRSVPKPSDLVLPKDHRDINVRSVIDIHLWDSASWTGVAFVDFGPGRPPAMALIYRDGVAGRKIFERWRQRFGQVDDQEDIYVAIVRDVSGENPAHYNVLITSRVPAEAESNSRVVMAPSRIHLMQPESDANLVRFLGRFSSTKAYWLIPGSWQGQGEPEFLFDLSIFKRQLSVKRAPEVGEHDIESIVLQQSMFQTPQA